jgi:hypothetical protein
MATSTIYFNRSGAIELDIGTVDFAHYAKITLKIGDTVIHTSPNLERSQDSYNWTPTDAEKALIISLMPTNATSVKGIMKKDVYWSVNNSEANLYDREFEVSFVLEATESTKPLISNTSKAPSELTDYVQGKSKLQYTLTATARNNASVKSVTVKVRGVACTLVSSADEVYIFESDLLAYSGTNAISIEVTDSRGFKRTTSDSIYVYPYAPPIMSSLASEDGIVCKRWNPLYGDVDDVAGEQCRVKVSVAMSYVPEILTSYSVYYRFRTTGETVWSDEKPLGVVTVTQSGSTVFTAIIDQETFNIDFEYDIELRVEDELSGINTRYEQLPSSKVPFNIKYNGMGASFGKYATRNYCVDSAWTIFSDEDIEAIKALKGKTLVLDGIEVTATAQELSYTSGSTGNLQKQITETKNLLNSWESRLDAKITALQRDVESLTSRVSALESK